MLFFESEAFDILCNTKPYYVVRTDELAGEAHVVLHYADEVNASAGFFRGIGARKPNLVPLELPAR